MKETTPAAMPPCFEKWCQGFDEAFTHKAQKRGFRHYLGGLLGESERKNLSQMASKLDFIHLGGVAQGIVRAFQ